MYTEQEQFWVQAAQAGDREAFGKLYDAIFPGLYGYVRARATADTDAEDVVSEVVLTVVKKLRVFRWQFPGSFRAWVFQIARRELADFYRHSSAEMESPDETLIDPLPGPETQAMQNEMHTHLLAHVQRLSLRKQEVIMLRYFAGLRNAEIAVVLDLDERTVAAHLSRALDDLQALIWEPT